MNLPALIIAYSRPDGVAEVLETLVSYGFEDIYISIDGPKNNHDTINQDEIVRNANKYLESNTRIHIARQNKNLGAAGGVLTAVEWFFANEEMGIIIEDDLRFNIDFCKFAEMSLIKYKNDPKVWMISGTQHFPNALVKDQVSWSSYPMIWGWAGWADKWKIMRDALLQRKKIEMKHRINKRYLFWSVGANRALSGKVDAWDIPLAFEFQKQKSLCVLPPVNLVSNIGNDDVATNTFDKDKSLNLKVENLPIFVNFTDQPNSIDLQNYNLLLEKNIFKIKFRHIFLPYYSFLFDFIRFPESKRKLPLSQRLAK
jgi:hypothetical protein